ncbi:excinuclease ABC subunit UvrA [Pirellulales bacterium]|nr:excinuclease ABC subunit UvrA [Pirellulales bacterium]
MEPDFPTPMIRLRGVAVHNLQYVDLDLPHRRLITFCGVSGSGKTSLALDTLYAAGQRRYLESFSAYTRQFLEQLDKPAAHSIDGIPPSVAITRKAAPRSSRATVGGATQIDEHLQMLLARCGRVVCWQCGAEVRRDSPESAASRFAELPSGTRFMIGFRSSPGEEQSVDEWFAELHALGYRRCLVGNRTADIDESVIAELPHPVRIRVVVDRLRGAESADDSLLSRLRDSLESAMDAGQGAAAAWIEQGDAWQEHRFSRRFRCEQCDIDYPELEPALLNPNNPLGACPECEGFGNVIRVDMDRVVPDRSKTIRDGAIAPWNTPAYRHELEELLALAGDYDIAIDQPVGDLSDRAWRHVQEGIPERDFGGLDGFFAWLERNKYKMHVRVFLSRWRGYYPCDTCKGARLKAEALAVHFAGKSFADIAAMKVHEAHRWLETAEIEPEQMEAGRLLLQQISTRLGYLVRVGIGHLTLDRPMRTLSGGEAHRVALTAALGSNLTGMLYVLDEPAAGLHPADMPQLVDCVTALRDRGNTVVAVEHEATLIREADEVVELGPGAGEYGGQIVFQGTPAEMMESPHSRTGDWLSGRRQRSSATPRLATDQGWIRLVGARGNNLKNLTVEFPLGVLCAVTGVSGAGKSTLVEQTLFPGVSRRLRKPDNGRGPTPRRVEHSNGEHAERDAGEKNAEVTECDVLGAGQVQDIVLVDSSPIGRSLRSNPVTYVKAFDPIRKLFAELPDAKSRGFTSGHFSFNVEGGRCEACQGDGFNQIDMKLMADVYLRCGECQGLRYRREVLEVKHRGLNIADVLELSVREAFTFFRGEPPILKRLKCLIDVGLDYVRLGQGANTLSGGEAQRLKLANYVGAAKRGRTLFVMDEPATGLHFSDVLQLLDCFESLISMGHSLIVVEHNLLLMQAADYIIDLGPGAAEAGGHVVAAGTPEEIAANEASATGRYLATALRAAELHRDDAAN